MTSHPSDSMAQRAAEPLIAAAVAEKLGVELQPTLIDRDGAKVQIDGASSDLHVLVEAYAHVGPLRGATRPASRRYCIPHSPRTPAQLDRELERARRHRGN